MSLKEGGAVLLEREHSTMTNPLNKSVVGWFPTSQGIGGLFNPRGFAMVRIVVQKLVDSLLRALYDQPVIVENAGSIVIAQLGDRVGMVRNFRLVSERLLPRAGASYIAELEKQGLWHELIESLGSWRWECPRGLVPPGAEPDTDQDLSLEEFVIKTAKLEALEEAGFHLEGSRIAGRVNTNPTFFTHAQYVVHAYISAVGQAAPEDLEIIGGNKLFTMAELRALNESGEFDDGLTLAALALCGMHL